MSGLQLYFILKLDNLVTGSTVILFLSLIFLVLSLGALLISHLELDKSCFNFAKTSIKTGFIVSIIFLLFCVFIPTTKQMAAIIIVPKIINNEEVQKIPEKLLILVNEWIDNTGKNK